MDCIFCDIASGAVPAALRRSTDALVAFDDIHPKAPTHVLVVPKAHILSVNELTPEHAAMVGSMVLLAQSIAVDMGIAEGGYKLVMNCGKDGGQVVPHLHLHLLGGKPLQGLV